MSSSQLRRVVLSTGNILEMEDLIRKAGQTTSEELSGSIKTTLNSWEGGKVDLQNGGVFTIQRNFKRLTTNDNSGTKTTVKLFLSNNESTQVEDAIRTVCDGLDANNSNIDGSPRGRRAGLLHNLTNLCHKWAVCHGDEDSFGTSIGEG
nr:uncharacterized protein LOC113824568 [Penaeus vannamei]